MAAESSQYYFPPSTDCIPHFKQKFKLSTGMVFLRDFSSLNWALLMCFHLAQRVVQEDKSLKSICRCVRVVNVNQMGFLHLLENEDQPLWVPLNNLPLEPGHFGFLTWLLVQVFVSVVSIQLSLSSLHVQVCVLISHPLRWWYQGEREDEPSLIHVVKRGDSCFTCPEVSLWACACVCLGV